MALFWGQIQLRKQQLTMVDPALNAQIEAKHLQEIKASFKLCQSPENQALLKDILREHHRNIGSKNIKVIYVFENDLPEALMLSGGTLLLSTTLLKDISAPALQALIAHEAGHLNLNHRLESRIYEQGTQIFYRQWTAQANIDYLLSAPLWVQYSRGQEAAADHWAFASLSSQNSASFKSLVKLWLAYEKNPKKNKGFSSRHPLATDRLQSLDQLPDLKATQSKDSGFFSLILLQKNLSKCS